MNEIETEWFPGVIFSSSNACQKIVFRGFNELKKFTDGEIVQNKK